MRKKYVKPEVYSDSMEIGSLRGADCCSVDSESGTPLPGIGEPWCGDEGCPCPAELPGGSG